MRILHVTDSHGTVKGPEGRKDIYYISFLKKLYELGYVIKKCGIDVVIHTGDMFHTARVSDKFAGQVADLITAFGVPVYVVPGNHDIEGYTIDTIDQTKLGLLAKTKTITLLDRDHPICINSQQGNETFTVAVSGQEYYAHIDEGNQTDFDMQQDEADLNILAIHGYIVTESQHPNIKCTMANDITTDANIILAGHYHRQFEYNGPDFDIYNPGSMMRVDQTEYNKTHTPQYGILDISLNDQNEVEYSYTFHKFTTALPSAIVFDYDAKYLQKSSSITLDGFKTSLANTMSNVAVTTDVLNIIGQICKTAQVETAIETLAITMYSDALQTTPDEFEAQPGYIESLHTKKISSVELVHFQSHEHTKVDFNDGLNIFVGESNSGKTSIFRAILWVIDNQPLGTGFIMAGEDECSVQINYSDGTYIKRGRTMKDTGYYEVKYIDENGNFDTATYRGFTNAVPVEVANVHQMPKVNITKDLETHLNVITQLEGPFLLTESPNTKASAIGRITGTHVVDKAISDSKNTIQGNKKAIKTYAKELEEKENELKALPDIAVMEEFFNAYSIVAARVEKLRYDIEHIEGLTTKIDDNNQLVLKETNKVSVLKVIASLMPVISKASITLDWTIKVHSDYEDYNLCDSNITEECSRLERTKVVASLRPVAANTLSLCQNYISLNTNYDRYMDINNQIDSEKDKSVLMAEYAASVKSVSVHCKLLKDYIEKIGPKMVAIDATDKEKQEAVKAISTSKQEIKKIKSSITKAKKTRDKFILDNHICPCCGQEITDAHTDSITKFMEG